ncbi:hypothetical protein F5Y04DRAFT_291158 [Hypomontagnella monticulosa]|nr:hypothetical protein F5Y04DRAFT_291158 [Hypomontagnella monticulosa]
MRKLGKLAENTDEQTGSLISSRQVADDGGFNWTPPTQKQNVQAPGLGNEVAKNGLFLPQPDSDPSSIQTPLYKNPLPIFPDFLLPDKYGEGLEELKRTARDAIQTRRFIPLIHPHILKRLMRNSFAAIMAEHQLIDLSDFIELLDAQHAASPTSPADSPARWAIINAIIAIALRYKTAPGSESEFTDIQHGYYQNATSVIPQLILQEPSLLSIQALLAMAIFASGIPDTQASTMLVTNASRQLELFGRGQSLAMGTEEAQRYKQLERVVEMFEKNASL